MPPDCYYDYRYRSGQLSSAPAFYDWVTDEPNATFGWYPQDLPAGDIPPDFWEARVAAALAPTTARFVNGGAGGDRVPSATAFNGRAGLVFDGTGFNTTQDDAGNTTSWATLLGSVSGNWCLVAAALPTFAPTITAPNAVTGVGGTPYNSAMVLADSNFRYGLGFASWDPGGGAHVYAISFIFNGAAFVSSWVDLGTALSATGYILTSQQDSGAGTLRTGTQSALGNLAAGGVMGASSAFVWNGRGGTGFGDNHFFGTIGGVFAKANAVYPTDAVDSYSDWWGV